MAEWKSTLSSMAKVTPAQKVAETREQNKRADEYFAGIAEQVRQARQVADIQKGKEEWFMRNAPLEIEELKAARENTRKELAELQRKFDDAMVTVAEISKPTPASGGVRYRGAGLIHVQGDVVDWLYQRESFGWRKVTDDKLWVYNGKIRDVDTYYNVDSAAITLSADTSYIGVKQDKVALTATIVQYDKVPQDNDTYFNWPLLRIEKMESPVSSGNYSWKVDKVYHTGDVYRQRWVLDANSVNDAFRNYSLQKRADGTVHHTDAEIYGFDSPTIVTIDSHSDLNGDTGKYLVMLRWKETANSARVVYGNFSEFRAKYADSARHADSARFAHIADTVSSGYFYSHALESHSDFYDDIDKRKALGKVAYCRADGQTWNWNYVSDAILNDTDGLAKLDSRWWANTAYANPSTKNYATSGTLDVSNGTAASTGGGGAGAIKASVGGIYAASGVAASKGSAGQAGSFDDGTRNVLMCDGVWAVATLGSVRVASGEYYHNDDQGWSGTFQVTQSGVTKDVTVSGGIIVNVA